MYPIQAHGVVRPLETRAQALLAWLPFEMHERPVYKGKFSPMGFNDLIYLCLITQPKYSHRELGLVEA
jgi:hypothetical protein